MNKIYYKLRITTPAEEIKWSGHLSWSQRNVFGESYARKGSKKREVVADQRGIIPRVKLNPCINKIITSLKQDKIDFIIQYNWQEGFAIICN